MTAAGRQVAADATPIEAPIETHAVSAALVRGLIAKGAIADARQAFGRLAEQGASGPEVLLVEAWLLAAENLDSEALDVLRRLLASRPAAARIQEDVARLAMRLGAAPEAEAAGRALTAQDPDNLDGLNALAFAYQRMGRERERLDTLLKLALAPSASEASIWPAVQALAEAGRWGDALTVLDGRELELAPRPVARLRFDALLRTGWHRRALDALLQAHGLDYLRVDEAIDIAIENQALRVGAQFVEAALRDDPRRAEARARLLTTAVEASASGSMATSPVTFSDAILARSLLIPGRAALTESAERAREFLIKQAKWLLAKGDAGLATDFLVQASRHDLADVAVLELLIQAARKAGRADRLADAAARLCEVAPDSSALLAAAASAFEASAWPTLAVVMTRLRQWAEAGDPRSNEAAARSWLAARLAELLAADDLARALALAGAGRGSWPIEVWPGAVIARLRSAAKRWLRLDGPVDDPALVEACVDYLAITPADVEVRRILARKLAKLRRPADAREQLSVIVARDPHLARDWLDLAVAHHDLGEAERRDYCTARALAISPGINLPAVSKGLIARMRPA